MKIFNPNHIHQLPQSVWLGLSSVRKHHGADKLSAEDEQELQAFTHKQRKHEFLTSRSVLRELAANLGYSRENTVFRKNDVGCPYGETENGRLFVSIAHTKSKVLCGLSNHIPLGIDIEPANRVIHHKLRERILNNDEREHGELDAVSTVRLWTVKEAVVKLAGIDMKKHLTDIDLRRSDENSFLATYEKQEAVWVYNFKFEKYWLSIATYNEDRFDNS